MFELLHPRTEAEARAVLPEVFRFRHHLFIEHADWDIPCHEEMEFDEFDTADAQYLLWRDETAEIRGMSRFIPTTAPYMIQVLWPDLLGDTAPPSSPRIWEISRFGIDPAVSAPDRMRITEYFALACVELGLVYTESVVNEALRLYPPVWSFGREARCPCTVGGYAVRTGTTLLLSPWLAHRDPRYFSRPLEFCPSRWRDGSLDALPKYAHLPFGGGPRLCIGSRFAMQETILLLACVARRFRFALDPSCDVVPFASITLRPAHGLRMRLERRPLGRQPDSASERSCA